ncbi:MAG TPA: DUF6599 family protein, partial [Pyrinomonadaceae bacterium]|nr:DUF6599 family protein [Pyrinomonadaceae bacterium]
MGLLGRLLFAAVLGVSLCANAAGAKSDSIPPETARLLPEQIGTFKAIDVAAAMPDYSPKLFSEGSFRTYAMDGGGRYTVNIRQTANDAEAFAWLTQARSYFKQSGHDWKLSFDDTGSASFMGDRSVFFYKGNTVVSVTAANDGTAAQTKELANQLAAQLDGGEGEIPVLVKHLPNWETAGKSAIYAVSLDDLKQAVPMSGQSQPVLDVLTFDGGTEAVTANYGPSQLVIVEFTTPQFSIDNDSRIWTKIAELKSQGQPTPTAYRRVGNYSVFVFNGPDEKTANALV